MKKTCGYESEDGKIYKTMKECFDADKRVKLTNLQVRLQHIKNVFEEQIMERQLNGSVIELDVQSIRLNEIVSVVVDIMLNHHEHATKIVNDYKNLRKEIEEASKSKYSFWSMLKINS